MLWPLVATSTSTNKTHQSKSMLVKKKKMLPGQNIRYLGKGFPGFIQGQPYMSFLAYQDELQISAVYNGIEVKVPEIHTEVIY